MFKRLTLLSLTLLILTNSVTAQDNKTDSGRVIVTPDVQERNQQRYETLQKADFAKLEIALLPYDASNGANKPTSIYKAGDRIAIKIYITNISAETVIIPESDTYSENRPRLLLDGELVPYRKEVAKLLEAKDKEPRSFSILPITLKPNKSLDQVLWLDYWYESLVPGHYELIMSHQFVFRGNRIESNRITFEVVSDQP